MSDSNPTFGQAPCDVIEELLPAFAEGLLNDSAGERVRRHMAACTHCEDRLDEIKQGVGLGATAVPDAGSEWEPGHSRSGVVPIRGARSARAGTKTAVVGAGLVGLGLLGGVVSSLVVPREQVAAEGAPRLAGVEAVVAGEVGRFGRSAADRSAVVSISGVGDDEVRRAGFALERPMNLLVHAEGEGTNGEMHDYAWIMDASNNKPVWRMSYRETGHAGGAEKNRMVDQVVPMQRGNYILYYATDGSHSAESWNAMPPDNPDRWGVSLFATRSSDRRAVSAYDPGSDPSILAQLVGVQDDDHLTTEFSLSRGADVRVYALGEGTGNTMHDYAWITDAKTRRVVWEMKYEYTDHAGGAEKNRMVNGTLELPRGEYVLHYETDDSHSFNDWNAAPPTDPFNYGVTVYRKR